MRDWQSQLGEIVCHQNPDGGPRDCVLRGSITDCRPGTMHGVVQAATLHKPLNIGNLFSHGR